MLASDLAKKLGEAVVRPQLDALQTKITLGPISAASQFDAGSFPAVQGNLATGDHEAQAWIALKDQEWM
jgi:hypothetical protein